VDHVEAPGFLRLVGLEMTHEVPSQAQICRLVHLRQSFLDLVLAEIDVTQIGGGANAISRERFRNGDEANRGGVASHPAGGPCDARADVVQPGAER
jgi:hypothetical protein